MKKRTIKREYNDCDTIYNYAILVLTKSEKDLFNHIKKALKKKCIKFDTLKKCSFRINLLQPNVNKVICKIHNKWKLDGQQWSLYSSIISNYDHFAMDMSKQMLDLYNILKCTIQFKYRSLIE